MKQGFELSPTPPWRVSDWEKTTRAVFKKAAGSEDVLLKSNENPDDLPQTLDKSSISLEPFYVEDDHGLAALYEYNEYDEQHWLCIRLEVPEDAGATSLSLGLSKDAKSARFRMLSLGDGSRTPEWVVQETDAIIPVEPSKFCEKNVPDAQNIGTGVAKNEHDFMESMKGLFI
jgi:hypothetical protein